MEASDMKLTNKNIRTKSVSLLFNQKSNVSHVLLEKSTVSKSCILSFLRVLCGHASFSNSPYGPFKFSKSPI